LVQIRPAEGQDLDALLAIEQQCFNVDYYDFYTLDRRDFEFYLADPDHLFLVAVLDNRVAGYVLGPVDPWRDPPRAHIDSIAVQPDLQHGGIGSQLLGSFRREVRRQGCTILTLEVSPRNEAGLAFFTKHGFRKIRILPNYYAKGLDALFMAADLTDDP
jgi:ribosomal-protein-alanine N-acetyltransferase